MKYIAAGLILISWIVVLFALVFGMKAAAKWIAVPLVAIWVAMDLARKPRKRDK